MHPCVSKLVRCYTQTTTITTAIEDQIVENLNWIKERNKGLIR